MEIQSIDIRNLYSFGNSGTKDLSGFKKFNLFIGKNGSGKSSVFYAFKNIQLHIEPKPYSVHLPRNIFNKSIHKCNGPATAKQDKQNDRDLHIRLDVDEVVFQHGRHESGDLSEFQAKVEIINASNSFDKFANKLRILSNHPEKEALLTFAYKYIFNKTIRIKDASITEDYQLSEEGLHRTGNSVFYGNMPENVQNETSCQWASGYIFIANLLADILLLDGKEVICIDEPELHIEPRVLRRLISFLFWLCLIQKKSRLDHDKALDKQWNKWFGENKDMFGINVANFSNSSYSPKQLFISSHSASLINEFLSNSKCCAIYEFDRTEEENRYHYPNSSDSKEEQVRYPIVSTVRRVAEFPHSVLNNLGANGADLLQANGIVWVEGPSDVIYIKKWLDMYSMEKDLPFLIQGYHYEFQMFGGTLLDSLCLIKEGLREEDEYKKLVSMFSFSRNAFIITDSDAIKKDNGEIADQSKFKNAKKFIAKQFDALTSKGYKLGLWYKENNAEIRTLEDYLDKNTIDTVRIKQTSTTKKLFAQKVVFIWGDGKKLCDFNHKLEDEIKIMDTTIRSWNE